MYDPLELGRETEKIVCREGMRKYYRFRATRFYGGSATADTVGCNLRCVYCWNWRINKNPSAYGAFYSPADVAHRLTSMARRRGLRYVRVTGGEPTLCFSHLVELIDAVPRHYIFILESNGLLLAEEERVKELSKFSHLYVRISLKGVDRESFSRITGAKHVYFDYQIRALELLHEYGIAARPAIPFNLFPPERIKELQQRLLEVDRSYILELEPVLDYGGAYKRLRNAGLNLYSY
ncbi:TPA: radical SAM protein [Candidatus Micrarchaeota archaeon]|nr:radical SAM protein [Candidatus Micrarchaeota archaeon]